MGRRALPKELRKKFKPLMVEPTMKEIIAETRNTMKNLVRESQIPIKVNTTFVLEFLLDLHQLEETSTWLGRFNKYLNDIEERGYVLLPDGRPGVFRQHGWKNIERDGITESL